MLRLQTTRILQQGEGAVPYLRKSGQQMPSNVRHLQEWLLCFYGGCVDVQRPGKCQRKKMKGKCVKKECRPYALTHARSVAARRRHPEYSSLSRRYAIATGTWTAPRSIRLTMGSAQNSPRVGMIAGRRRATSNAAATWPCASPRSRRLLRRPRGLLGRRLLRRQALPAPRPRHSFRMCQSRHQCRAVPALASASAPAAAHGLH